jgi:ATP-binding cassette subfamily F protein 3
MLHISALTYRLGERLLIDNATAALPSGAHVGLVGRNGAGKTTLFRLIRGDLSPESGAILIPKGARFGSVEQEAPGGRGRSGLPYRASDLPDAPNPA